MSDIYQYYPEFQDKDFYKKIFSKKEFNIYKIPKQTQNMDKMCNPTDFNLLPQQNFLKNYISIDTPYNGILIFHGTGVGKTCAAISIAEGFRETIKQYNNKVLVILGPNLQGNFKKELFNFEKEKNKERGTNVQCTGTKYSIYNNPMYQHLTHKQKIKKIDSLINQFYEFFGYTQITNVFKKVIKWEGNFTLEKIKKNKLAQDIINEQFSNRVIIIDEVHNIRSDKDNIHVKNVPPIIEAIITYSNNIKLILMSATPMYNRPTEIIFILNLLLLNDNQEKIKNSDIFDKDDNLTKNGAKILTNMSKGYISYLKGENPITFPLKLIPNEAITPNKKYDIFGRKINKENTLKFIKLISCPMGNFQYKAYKNQIVKDMGNRSNNKRVFNTFENGTYVLNMSYMDKRGRPIYAGDAFQNYDNGLGGFVEIKKKIKGKMHRYYKYQEHMLFNRGLKNETPFLDISKLEQFSTKYFKILQFIMSCKGLVFVYSRNKIGGIIPFCLMLEQNGFLRYESGQTMLDYSPNKLGGGGKRIPNCYFCENETKNKVHIDKNDPNYHEWAPSKYIVLGGTDLSYINIDKAIQIFNDKSNKYGRNVKIIIGTDVTKEGLDFHRVRQIHVINPWFNFSKIDQVVGRAIRNCSHKDMPIDERNVEVFLYASSVPNTGVSDKEKYTETIDERNYRYSEQGDIQIKLVERILKQNAVDCNLNKNINHFYNIENQAVTNSRRQSINYKLQDLSYTKYCDYMKDCNYKCNWEPGKDEKIIINNDTYSYRFSKFDINNAKKIIKFMYKLNYSYNIRQIIDFVNKKNKNIEYIYIYIAINELLENKEILNDKYNREGYITFNNSLYTFQPNHLNYMNFPIYYLKTPLTYKPTDINISRFFHLTKNDSNVKNKFKLDYNIYSKISDNVTNIFNIINNYDVFDKNVIYKLATEFVLDRLNSVETILLLDNLITDREINKIKNIKYKKLLLNYYDNIFIKQYRDIDYNKNKISNNNKIIGFRIGNNYYCYNNNMEYKKCSSDIMKEIEMVQKLRGKLNSEDKKYAKIIGKVNITSNNVVKFYIIDNSQDVKIMTEWKEKSKRSKVKGRVCNTYKTQELKKIYNILGLKNIYEKKNEICVIIELYLRYLNYIKKDDKIWFLGIDEVFDNN